MPKREDMDRHDRPSWRDMDKKRDRSRHGAGAQEGRREPRSEKERANSKVAKDAYLKKLDQKLFGGSKKKSGGAAERAVRDARGTRNFSETCDSYIENSGFPVSGDLLLLFLDHENAETVLRALDALAPMIRAGSVDRDALVKALRRVKSITDNADVESAADELLESV